MPVFWCFGSIYSIVLLRCLYSVCEKYVFVCPLRQIHIIHTIYCSWLCLMESIQWVRNVFKLQTIFKEDFYLNQILCFVHAIYPDTVFCSCYLPRIFLYTYNLSQISNKGDLFRGRTSCFEGQTYCLIYFISLFYFISLYFSLTCLSYL